MVGWILPNAFRPSTTKFTETTKKKGVAGSGLFSVPSVNFVVDGYPFSFLGNLLREDLMRTWMAIGAALLVNVFGSARETEEDLVAVRAADVKWSDAKDAPQGVKAALIWGDPAKGPFAMLAKVPAGASWAPHWHSTDEVIAVLSGEFVIGLGEKVDETKGQAIDAGGYFTLKAKVAHWGRAKEDTLLVRYGNGPADITYIKK